MKDPVTNACPISGPPNWENTIFQGISHPMENIGDLGDLYNAPGDRKTQYKCKGGNEMGRENKQGKMVHASSSSGLKSRKRKEKKSQL